MSQQSRRSRGIAAASMATVSFLPVCAAAAADVEVSIKNHTAQDVIEGPNVAVQADFKSSTGHNIQRVEFLVDGQVVETETLEQPAQQGTFIFAWDTTRISNDVHTITTRAYDDQNHIGASNLQLFVDNQKVDKEEPALRITVPRQGAVVSGHFNIRVQGQQRSASEPIPYVIVKLDNDIIGWFQGASSANFPCPNDMVPDGPHRLQLATRLASNQEVLSPPIIVIVDKGGGLTEAHFGPKLPPIDIPGDSPGSTDGGNSVAPPPPIPHVTQVTTGGSVVPDSGSSVGSRNQRFAEAANAGLPGGTSGESTFQSGTTGTIGAPIQVTPPVSTTSGSPTVNIQQNAPRTGPSIMAMAPTEPPATVETHANGWYASADSPTAELDNHAAALTPASIPSVGSIPVVDSAAAPQLMAMAQSGGEQPVFYNALMAPSTDRVDAVKPVAHPLQVALGPFSHGDSAPVPSASGSTAPTPSDGAINIEPAAGSIFIAPPPSAPKTNVRAPLGPPAAGHWFPNVPSSGAMPPMGGHSAAPSRTIPSGDQQPVALLPAAPTRIIVVKTHHSTLTNPRVAMVGGGRASSEGSGSGSVFSGTPTMPVRVQPGTAPKVTAMRPPEDTSDAAYLALKSSQPSTPQWLKLAYNNHPMFFDVPPRMVHNVPVTPFRALFEFAGGTVDWHPANQTVTGQSKGKLILIQIGSTNAMINNRPVSLVLPAFVEKGRTLVPVGFISQAMDLNVHFNQKTGEIILTSKHVLALATD